MNYEKYKCKLLHNRLFSFADIDKLINETRIKKWQTLGKSYLGKPIRMLTLGTGPVKIMVWSQMHGDESTATAVIFDLINFLKAEADENKNLRNSILSNCSLYFIPLINPDGLIKFTRNNAQNIDINRDFIAQQSPEGKILKKIRDDIKPDFCFNMHDQSTLYCTKNKQAVAMAFLAPSYDATLQLNWVREQAIKVIICMVDELQKHIPLQIARFNDSFEPRAFGDNFQKAGSSTILIESGGRKDDDEKQLIRKFNFIALIKAFEVIANNSYQNKKLASYSNIPENEKNIFHILFKNVLIKSKKGNYRLDVGVNYTEKLNVNTRTLSKLWHVEEVGDLSIYTAYQVIEASEYYINKPIKLSQLASLKLFNSDNELSYSWQKGKLI